MKRLAVSTLLLAACMLANVFLPRMAPAEPGAGDQALAMVADLRTTAAKLVWLQADVYHHAMEAQGVGFNGERDILPLLRLVVFLDPNFEEAYDVAAYHLVMSFDKPEEGLAFIRQGLHQRPRSPELRLSYTFLLFKAGHYATGAAAGEAALEVLKDERMRSQCMHLIAHCKENTGDTDGAIAEWKHIIEIDPADGVARHELRRVQGPSDERPNP